MYELTGDLIRSFTDPIVEFPTAPGKVYLLLPIDESFNTVDFELYQPNRPPAEQNRYGAPVRT